MADHPRIYPAASPPPEEASRSAKTRPTNHEPPLATSASGERPPSRCCCCCYSRLTCMLWTILAAAILIIFTGAAAGIIYLVFRFKIPKYSIDRLALSAFKINGSLGTVRASFMVTITAENPNAKMGIYYLDGGRVSALYDDDLLGSGSFPAFYQGHRNTTVIDVVVSGEAPLAGPVVTALRQRQQETGTVPITVRGDVPVRAEVGKLKLWRATARARCDLLVDAVNPMAHIGILSDSCSFKLKL